MGIKGIYQQIGPGQRIALSKLSIELYEQKGRPLRLAIDISIWLFQIQSAKGGSNPALRTFYYRLLRLISLSIHPLFVFDGPNKPPFKRNKRTGPNVASIPEFLAKQLLRHFGLPFHFAPGEAEAECALLQRKGIVDAVLSEDVDTLMFGSGLTMRNWSPEGSIASKVPTHINLYDAERTKAGSSGLDREGMILVALMSGGDYIPEGIPGCGPKTACEAARAGFGAELCKIRKHDKDAMSAWKARLCHELKTNESKFFRAKHKALVIPEDFPRLDVLGYYTDPCLSSDEKIAKLVEELKWDQEINISELRQFAADAFDWTCVGGAKKFVRNLAPAILIKQLRLQAQEDNNRQEADLDLNGSRLVKSIHSRRNHISTDLISELKIGFTPIDLVGIDLSKEEPDPESTQACMDSDDEQGRPVDGDDLGSPRKKRGVPTYDPVELDKIWISETLVKTGVPVQFRHWLNGVKESEAAKATKAAKKQGTKRGSRKAVDSQMREGALDPFTRVSKPVDKTSRTVINEGRFKKPNEEPPQSVSTFVAHSSQDVSWASTASAVIDLSMSPRVSSKQDRRVLQRSISDTSVLEDRGPFMPAIKLSKQPVERPELSTDITSNVEAGCELSPFVSIRSPRYRRVESLLQHEIVTQVGPSSDILKQSQQCPLPETLHDPTAVVSPLTPSKTQGGSNRQNSPLVFRSLTPKSTSAQNIITIDSSPPATNSTQRFITHWLTPKHKQVPPNLSACAEDMDVGPSDLLASPSVPNYVVINSSPAAVGNLNTQSLQSNTAHGLNSQAPRRSPRGHEPAIWRGRAKQKKALRLRTSLQGAWAFEVTSDAAEASPNSNNTKRSKTNRWRQSQVQTLDLTDG